MKPLFLQFRLKKIQYRQRRCHHHHRYHQHRHYHQLHRHQYQQQHHQIMKHYSKRYFKSFKPNLKNIYTILNQVTVDIYYTTWCRHSMNFLRNFFRPAYESIKDYATVKFIPLDHRFISRFLLCGLAALGDNQDAKVKFVTCDESNRKVSSIISIL